MRHVPNFHPAYRIIIGLVSIFSDKDLSHHVCFTKKFVIANDRN